MRAERTGQIPAGELAGKESLRAKEIAVEARRLAGLVAKVDFYGTDQTDEFSVVRENGQSQGIFKTWAVPIIPFWAEERLDELQKMVEDGTAGAERLENHPAVLSWTEEMRDEPKRLWQTIESWRGFSQIYDRRLYESFRSEPLPQKKNARVAELYWRLRTAFGYAAPFYHIESMVADSRDSDTNLLANQKEDGGGFLDLAVMMMPSALKNTVVAEKTNWNGLDWQKIAGLRKNLTTDDLAVAMRIAQKAETGVDDVIFAANVLQFIPVSVGGKKTDLPVREARRGILLASREKRDPTVTSVCRDTNALIRFLNWMPLVKNNDNFSGNGWRYAAVCDTANQLLAELKEGGVFAGDFEQVFREKLAPQIAQVDATSAKGRFILQLFGEGKIRPECVSAIKERENGFFDRLGNSLAEKERQEAVVAIHSVQPRMLVGGKVAGLRQAGEIFGQDSIAGGVVLTTEAVNNWLKTDPELWTMIKRLAGEQDVEKKLEIGRLITQRITALEFPVSLGDAIGRHFRKDYELVARSSSFDEDTIINGTAAGIYESVTKNVSLRGLPEAIKTVIASFFSEKAISYRYFQGLPDRPLMAVGIQELIKGHGGNAFSKGGGCWEVTIGETPGEIAGEGENGFDCFEHSGRDLWVETNKAWLPKKTACQAGKMVSRAEKLFGAKQDMEFVVDSSGKVIVLQLRSLPDKEIQVKEKNIWVKMSAVNVDSVADLRRVKPDDGELIELHLSEGINIDQFQGDLFRWLVKTRGTVAKIVLPKRIPPTCHFANICLGLGIMLEFANEEKPTATTG